MEKVNIKTLKDLNKLKIGETYEIEEWGLEPEIIEEGKKVVFKVMLYGLN